MSGLPSRTRQLQLLFSALFIILTACFLLFLQERNANCQEEGDFTIEIEFDATTPEVVDASIDAPRYWIPVYISGTRASGETTLEAQQGHELTVLTFEGTLEGDILRGDISYELTGSTAGYESTWTYSFYKPDVEFSVAEGSYTSVLVKTSLEIEESGEGGSDSYTETISFHATAFPTGEGESGTGTIEEETGNQTDGDKTVGATPQPPGGIREIGDIPGPYSWPQAAIGILLPGFIGLIIALLTSLFKGGAPPAGIPPAGPFTPPKREEQGAERRVKWDKKREEYMTSFNSGEIDHEDLLALDQWYLRESIPIEEIDLVFEMMLKEKKGTSHLQSAFSRVVKEKIYTYPQDWALDKTLPAPVSWVKSGVEMLSDGSDLVTAFLESQDPVKMRPVLEEFIFSREHTPEYLRFKMDYNASLQGKLDSHIKDLEAEINELIVDPAVSSGMLADEVNDNYLKFLDREKKIYQLQHLKDKRQQIDHETIAYHKRLQAGWPGR